jgi:hypothetical protein
MKCSFLKKIKEFLNGPELFTHYIKMSKMEFGNMKRAYHNKQETHLVFRKNYKDQYIIDYVDTILDEYGEKTIEIGTCGYYNGKKLIFEFNKKFTDHAKLIPEGRKI